MSVLMIIDLKAKAGSIDELRAYVKPAETRAFAGNEGVEVAVNDQSVLVVAHWATWQDYDAYLARRAELGDDALFDLLEGGREGFSVRAFDVVDKPRAKRSKTREHFLGEYRFYRPRQRRTVVSRIAGIAVA